MGIKERRERERAAVREQIIEAAEKIAADKDWDAVTIRAVAAAIEYSPALIYEYFKNKDEMLVALMRKGFARLHETLAEASATAATPEAAVEALGLAYWDFALASPTLYQLMHGFRGVPFGTDETPPEARACFEDLRSAIARLMAKAGASESQSSGDQTDLYWAYLHGLVSLCVNHRIKGGTERASTLVHRLARDFIQSCTASAAAWKTQLKQIAVG